MDIGKIMGTWTNQMGFPVVHVSKTGWGKGTAMQKHFFLDSNPINKQSDIG
jgi:aminopeptidase N